MPSHETPINSSQWSTKAPTTTPIPRRFPTVDGDRAVLLLSSIGDMVLHCSVQVDGLINEQQLARATRLLMDQEPVAGCSLRYGWWQPYWERRNDLDTVTLCTVFETDTPEEDATAWMTKEFDPSRDPLVQIGIFRSARDRIVFKVSHLIVDAGGTKQVAYMIAGLYRQLSDTPAMEVTPNLKGDRSFAQVMKQFGWRDKFAWLRLAFRDAWKRAVPWNKLPLKGSTGQPTQRTYSYVHTSQAEGEQLKLLSRQHQATINDILITALARGIYEYLDAPDGTPLRLVNTVDLRRYMPRGEAEALCNLSCFSYPCLGPKTDQTFTEQLSIASHTMQTLKKDVLGMGDVPSVGLLVRWAPFGILRVLFVPLIKRLYPMMSPAFTNMGRIDEDKLRFDDVGIEHAWLTASVIYPPFLVGGISGFRNRITLSLGHCETSLDKTKADQLLSNIANHLRQPLS